MAEIEDDLISINVWLAGRSYRIRIKPDEEEAVRKAVKMADDQIIEMRSSYAGKDDQDFVAMCLLMHATDNVTEGSSSVVVQQEVRKMIGLIDAQLVEDK